MDRGRGDRENIISTVVVIIPKSSDSFPAESRITCHAQGAWWLWPKSYARRIATATASRTREGGWGEESRAFLALIFFAWQLHFYFWFHSYKYLDMSFSVWMKSVNKVVVSNDAVHWNEFHNWDNWGPLINNSHVIIFSTFHSFHIRYNLGSTVKQIRPCEPSLFSAWPRLKLFAPHDRRSASVYDK